jgi:hypothetical protein
MNIPPHTDHGVWIGSDGDIAIQMLDPTIADALVCVCVCVCVDYFTLLTCRHTKQVVALKIVKSAPHYTEAAEDEIELLRCVSSNQKEQAGVDGEYHIVQMLDSFKHTGPHGRHMVMVFEVLGDNLLSVIDDMPRGLPLDVCMIDPNDWIVRC